MARTKMSSRLITVLLVLAGCFPTALSAESGSDRQSPSSASQRGYELLTTKAYLPPDFDQQIFDELWRSWEEPLRSEAERASLQERRRMAFSRYGLTQLPDAPAGRPMQYVVDAQGNWSMNCLACHQGKVAGQVIPGAPNTLFALETLTDEVRSTKLRLDRPLARMDMGSLLMPLGTSNGTTNAVMFGVLLLSFRDADLNVLDHRTIPKMVHHDHDAPAWWNFRKRQTIYSDGFAEKNHRALMQFLLVKENGPTRFHQWEDDFRDIYAYLESLRPPKYPWPVDEQLAARGQLVFNDNCARCHGTYGADESYPNTIVPIDEVATDRLRLDALTVKHREHYRETWFDNFGQSRSVTDPGGYVAPPLDGIWASAPYFHNGSVPTLWHVLHPEQRPHVWLRTEDGYDRQRMGLEISELETLPDSARSSAKERRRYFDTSRPGKSAAGHDFPNELSESERKAVLEYFKTL